MKLQPLTTSAMTILLPVALCLPIFGQQVVGVKSGVIHYVEGDVFASDQKIETKLGAKFAELKENQVLRSEEGRAEVLLNPGVFLRVAETSEIRMISNKLSDTRIELLSGSVLVEVSELGDGNATSFFFKDHQIIFRKTSLVRIDADPPVVKVYQGEASVTFNGQMSVLKTGKSLSLDGNMQVAKFDVKESDAFYRWGSRRASYVAMANVSTARSLLNSGYAMQNSGWFYNPYYGFATFIPMNGMYRNPWGYNYYSPGRVYRYYSNYAQGGGGGYQRPTTNPGFSSGPTYNSSLGYNVDSRSSMSSNVNISAPAAQSSSPSAPSVSRSDAAGAGNGGAVSQGGGASGRR